MPSKDFITSAEGWCKCDFGIVQLHLEVEAMMTEHLTALP